MSDPCAPEGSCRCPAGEADCAREDISPELAERIRRGIEQAERGETRDLGSFAEHLEGDE